MKKIVKKTFLTLFALLSIYVIYGLIIEEQIYMGKIVGIYVPIFNKTERKSYHVGITADGETLITMKFSDKQAEKFIQKIKENDQWSELPIIEKLEIISHSNKDIPLPHIENGYWFAIDRYPNKLERYTDDIRKYDIEAIWRENRHAYNYTVAMFDTDNNVFYFYEVDT